MRRIFDGIRVQPTFKLIDAQIIYRFRSDQINTAAFAFPMREHRSKISIEELSTHAELMPLQGALGIKQLLLIFMQLLLIDFKESLIDFK